MKEELVVSSPESSTCPFGVIESCVPVGELHLSFSLLGPHFACSDVTKFPQLHSGLTAGM